MKQSLFFSYQSDRRITSECGLFFTEQGVDVEGRPHGGDNVGAEMSGHSVLLGRMCVIGYLAPGNEEIIIRTIIWRELSTLEIKIFPFYPTFNPSFYSWMSPQHNVNSENHYAFMKLKYVPFRRLTNMIVQRNYF